MSENNHFAQKQEIARELLKSAIGSRCQYGVRTAVRKCADFAVKGEAA
jgi:hypothetical protein